MGGLFGLEGFNCKIVCQGSDSEGEAAVSAVEKNDAASTPATTTETWPEKPKVKNWPRPASTRPVRNGRKSIIAGRTFQRR